MVKTYRNATDVMKMVKRSDEDKSDISAVDGERADETTRTEGE